jgi:hypothetical protein
MADYCLQCSEDYLGMPGSDFVGVITEEDWVAGYVGNVLCEGCGFTQVDHVGRCVNQTHAHRYIWKFEGEALLLLKKECCVCHAEVLITEEDDKEHTGDSVFCDWTCWSEHNGVLA